MSARIATQVNRLLGVHLAPLSPDDLLLVEMNGTEAVSSLFSFELKCLSEVPEKIKLAGILDAAVNVRVRLRDGSARYFNGIVSRCSCDGREDHGPKSYTKYTLEVVPWLWLLTRSTDCRIFQDKTAPEIIEAVFRDLGFTDFENELIASYEKRDYCVQYRETDFNFVSRLMEEEGIFYYFKHENGKHTLMLADSTNYQPCPKQESVRFDPVIGTGDRDDRVLQWSERRELRSGKVSYRDQHFQMPDKTLDASIPTSIKVGGNSNLELYDYPGLYAPRYNKPEQRLSKVEPLGSTYAQLRMEEEEAQHLIVRGESTCRAFSTGTKFKFDAPWGLTSGEFMLTSVKHVGRAAPYFTGEQNTETYQNEFTCMPVAVPFRPQRTTVKPLIHGSQTATVVGPAGEEIWPDKFGRVLLQFNWDRLGGYDEHSSCWVRVSQTHAGRSFGCVSLPRIGEECVVTFLEGDPDQPLIIGRVYNADNMPPFDLPEGKTRSGIKSQTHKGAGYNEMTMDDTAGKEQIRIHGQYNMDTRVENDETHSIGMNRTKDIGVDETMQIGNNQVLTVGVNRTVTVGNNHTETIAVNQTVKVGSNQSTSVGINQTNNVGVIKNEMVGAMSNEMVGIAKTTSVGAAYALTVGAAMNTAVGFISCEEVGMNKKIIVGSKLEIICGASRLVMEAGGKVTIEGTEFLFSASGNVKVNGAVIDLN